MKFFDSHAHYTDKRFEDEFPGGVEALLREIYSSDVGYIMNTVVDLDDARKALELAEEHPRMCVSAGIFPTETYKYDDTEKALEELRVVASDPLVRAIGEIGLDYHIPEETDREKQLMFLDKQLTVAEELGLPVIFHDRDAHSDSLDAVFSHPNVKGVFHCFSGSREMARELVRRGWYISFTGVVTFNNARRVCEVASEVPSDRYLIETDAPYLAPVPHRGALNRSDYLEYTAGKIAELRKSDIETVARESYENAARLFSVSP